MQTIHKKFTKADYPRSFVNSLINQYNKSFDGISQVETDTNDMLICRHYDKDHHRCLIRCLEKAQKIGMTLHVEKRKFKET